MSVIQAFILGIVEGITEFLPISSTAHLAITSKLIGLTQSNFVKSFEIVIQFGAILSVAYLYWQKIIKDIRWVKKLAIAFIPTAIIGFLLYKIIKNIFMEDYTLMVWSLIIGGVIMIIFEMTHKESKEELDELEELTTKKCLAIGLFQALAVIPGVSRSAATIIGGLILGIKRKTIVEFSFLLAVPTMLAASVYDLSKNTSDFNRGNIGVLAIGLIVSFCVALASIKFLLNYVRKNNFIPFGIYRIIIGIILIALFL